MFMVEKEIVTYFENHREHFFESWANKVIINENDPLSNKIFLNAISAINLMFKTLVSLNENENDNELIELSSIIAKDLAHSNVDVGTYVYNVNTGRSIVFQQLHHFDFPISAMQPSIDKLNNFFDKFLYYTIKEHSKLMLEIYEASNQFKAQSQKDRLTILGQLTTSFVHEFRNPLTAVIGFIQLMKSDNPNLPYIDIVQQELDQLKLRISQFLLLSKQETNQDFERFNMANLIEETIEFIYPHIVNNNIKVIENLEPMEFFGSKEELKQVFVNILFNSIEALDSVDEIEKKVIVTLATSDKDLTIRISNNGPKIKEQHLTAIFEPFITTKETGTGIGLYVCSEIIKRHAGELSCESTDDMTIFTIKLKENTLIDWPVKG